MLYSSGFFNLSTAILFAKAIQTYQESIHFQAIPPFIPTLINAKNTIQKWNIHNDFMNNFKNENK